MTAYVDVKLARLPSSAAPSRCAPDLDSLFAVPEAAITLEAAMGLRPTGLGSVCFRAAEGGAFAAVQDDIQQLLDADGGPKVEASTDAFGFTWLLVRHDPLEHARAW